MIQRVVEISLAAQMHNLILLQEFRESFADMVVYIYGAKASAHDENDRLVLGKTGEGIAALCAALSQFFPDRSTGNNSLAFRQAGECLRKIAADFGSIGNAYFICETWRHVRFMNDYRNPAVFCREDDRDRYETAFRKHNVRTNFFHQFSCFKDALHHTKGIRQILGVDIPAQFPGRYSIIGDSLGLNQALFNSVVGTDVGNLVSQFLQAWNQGYIRSYMTGGTAACENDVLHQLASIDAVSNIGTDCISFRSILADFMKEINSRRSYRSCHLRSCCCLQLFVAVRAQRMRQVTSRKPSCPASGVPPWG